MNTELLNAAKDQIIKIANSNSMNLKDEFGTPENFKNFVVSLTIKMVMDIGKISIQEAFDLVMGGGSFQKMSDDIWTQLNNA
jgi:hypothetical protein